VVTAVLSLALAACADDKAPGKGASSSTPSSTTSTGGSASTSPPPTPSSAAPSRQGGPLLSADELPDLANGARWLVVSTTPNEPPQFGTCQRFGILSIGAERVVVRRFRPADVGESPNLAGELLATFPDEMTARRAYSVLESWHKQCGSLLRQYTDPQVGALRSVSVGDAQGAWYLLTYGPVTGRPGKVFLDTQGMVLVGKRIAMLSMVGVGTRGGAPPPMADALSAAAARL
jgi:hypothetical protein